MPVILLTPDWHEEGSNSNLFFNDVKLNEMVVHEAKEPPAKRWRFESDGNDLASYSCSSSPNILPSHLPESSKGSKLLDISLKSVLSEHSKHGIFTEDFSEDLKQFDHRRTSKPRSPFDEEFHVICESNDINNIPIHQLVGYVGPPTTTIASAASNQHCISQTISYAQHRISYPQLSHVSTDILSLNNNNNNNTNNKNTQMHRPPVVSIAASHPYAFYPPMSTTYFSTPSLPQSLNISSSTFTHNKNKKIGSIGKVKQSFTPFAVTSCNNTEAVSCRTCCKFITARSGYQLVIHIGSHEAKARRYACSSCPFSSSVAAGINNHLRRKHKEAAIVDRCGEELYRIWHEQCAIAFPDHLPLLEYHIKECAGKQTETKPVVPREPLYTSSLPNAQGLSSENIIEDQYNKDVQFTQPSIQNESTTSPFQFSGKIESKPIVHQEPLYSSSLPDAHIDSEHNAEENYSKNIRFAQPSMQTESATSSFQFPIKIPTNQGMKSALEQSNFEFQTYFF